MANVTKFRCSLNAHLDCRWQTLTWAHPQVGENVQLTLRWWDAMNRPNGKSLVVFGLSRVLCTSNVLDDVLHEAGVEDTDPPTPRREGGMWNQDTSKAALLEGKGADAVQRVVQNMKFTQGARLVCSVLRAMG